MSTLSLCMIVRDEAELLPQCLEHVDGLWDELIVVDTGSVDDTASIATRAGALLLSHPWNDDFAEARNVGLEAASGEWILILDADEMVGTAAAAAIRDCLSDPGAGAGRVVMRNHLPHGHKRDTHLLRLFRNDPSIRFEYPIHETVAPTVEAFLTDRCLSMRWLGGVVEHLGYVRDRAAARNKKERDLQILLHCTLEDPADFYSWFKILELARFWGDERLWRSVSRRVRRALEASHPNLRAMKTAGEFLALVAARGFEEPADAVTFMNRWEDQISPSAEFLMSRGEFKEGLGETAGAQADFAACLELTEVTANRQMASVRPALALARLHMAAGRLPEADANVRVALGHNPRDPEALFAAVALRTRSAVHDHAEVFEELAREHGCTPELHSALAEMALLQGRAEVSVQHFRMAAEALPDGAPGLRLAQALLAFGDPAAARRLAASLIPTLPEAAIGVMVADLVEGEDSSLEIDLEIDEASDALRRWVDTALSARHPDVLGRLRYFAPAVAELFPWLPAYLDAA